MVDIDKIKEKSLDLIANCNSLAELEALRVNLMGRKGTIADIMSSLKNISPDERQTVGREANLLKSKLSQALESRKEDILLISSDVPDYFDTTIPGQFHQPGGIHPITQMTYDLNDAFLSLGFEIYDGDELTSELFAFDNLNFPPDHPARDSMDTYWLDGDKDAAGADRKCLRPHLTGDSVKKMLTGKPPFRFIYPGRVYRSESTDARHERAFFQYEALIVDKDIPFSSGQLLIKTILDTVFGVDVVTRMRAGYFPFVEPGFEIDMRCLVCEGKGCSVCKRVGWLEIMPGGAPHPNVMKAAGIDPNVWSGFFINVGLDRLVMMRYGIDDIRLFHSADLRFLRQFT